MKSSILTILLLASLGVMGQSKKPLFHVMDSAETATYYKQPHMFLMQSRNGTPDSPIVIYGDTIQNIRNLWRQYILLQEKYNLDIKKLKRTKP